jgi:predicted enzyme related to lactoylglutathione lyase
MTALLHNISLDCADPYQLAQFWTKVVDRPIGDDDHPGDPEIGIDLGNGIYLLFLRVPESKAVKNRMHICLRAATTRDEEVQRLQGIGAKIFDDRRNADGTGWVVMQDPEGNEFCVERSAAERQA